MREGMVLYDADGREIWACPNVDSRAADEAAELVRSGAARQIFETAGDWVAITSPARFLWIRAHEPDVFGAIAHVGMLSDWVLYRLTGRFVTDPSPARAPTSSTCALGPGRPRSLELVGLRPVGRARGPRAGHRRRAADRRGRRRDRAWPPGTPVVVGGADTQLGLVGIGVVRPGPADAASAAASGS